MVELDFLKLIKSVNAGCVEAKLPLSLPYIILFSSIFKCLYLNIRQPTGTLQSSSTLRSLTLVYMSMLCSIPFLKLCLQEQWVTEVCKEPWASLNTAMKKQCHTDRRKFSQEAQWEVQGEENIYSQ